MREATASHPVARALVADIGGTHHRFAVVAEDGSLAFVERGRNADVRDFEAALGAVREKHALGPLDAVAVAVAGPVRGGFAKLTNCPWTVSLGKLAQAANARHAFLDNDLQAVARALPVLGAEHVQPLGARRPSGYGPQAVIGIGTGIGVAALARDAGEGEVALASEGGHVDLAPRGDIQRDVLGRVSAVGTSAESVLAGPGFARLYRAVAAWLGEQGPAGDMRLSEAFAGAGEVDRAAARVYTELLGQFARGVALTFGATGGVYLAGSIAEELSEAVDTAQLRTHFETAPGGGDGGQGWLRDVPISVLRHPNPALVGLARMVTAS